MVFAPEFPVVFASRMFLPSGGVPTSGSMAAVSTSRYYTRRHGLTTIFFAGSAIPGVQPGLSDKPMNLEMSRLPFVTVPFERPHNRHDRFNPPDSTFSGRQFAYC